MIKLQKIDTTAEFTSPSGSGNKDDFSKKDGTLKLLISYW